MIFISPLLTETISTSSAASTPLPIWQVLVQSLFTVRKNPISLRQNQISNGGWRPFSPLIKFDRKMWRPDSAFELSESAKWNPLRRF